MLFKLNLCQQCAAKLRTILQVRGEDAMAAAVGDVLCDDCYAKVPGYARGLRLTVRLKKTPPIPEGHA